MSTHDSKKHNAVGKYCIRHLQLQLTLLYKYYVYLKKKFNYMYYISLLHEKLFIIVIFIRKIQRISNVNLLSPKLNYVYTRCITLIIVLT